MSGFLCALIVKQLFDIVQIQPQNMERIFFFFFGGGGSSWKNYLQGLYRALGLKNLFIVLWPFSSTIISFRGKLVTSIFVNLYPSRVIHLCKSSQLFKP